LEWLGQRFWVETIPKSLDDLQGADSPRCLKQTLALVFSFLQALLGLYEKPEIKWRLIRPSRATQLTSFTLVYLLCRSDQEKLTEGVEKLQSWLHNYIPLQATTSDIAVL
jgi:hypothetical protein